MNGSLVLSAIHIVLFWRCKVGPSCIVSLFSLFSIGHKLLCKAFVPGAQKQTETKPPRGFFRDKFWLNASLCFMATVRRNKQTNVWVCDMQFTKNKVRQNTAQKNPVGKSRTEHDLPLDCLCVFTNQERWCQRRSLAWGRVGCVTKTATRPDAGYEGSASQLPLRPAACR